LVFGVERYLFVVLWAVAAGLVLGVADRWAIGMAIFLVTAGHGALCWVARKDPQFSEVYTRNLWRCRQDYYPARAGWAAADPRGQHSMVWKIAACWICVPLFCFWLSLMLPFEVSRFLSVGLGLIGAAVIHWRALRTTDPRPTVPPAIRGWF